MDLPFKLQRDVSTYLWLGDGVSILQAHAGHTLHHLGRFVNLRWSDAERSCGLLHYDHPGIPGDDVPSVFPGVLERVEAVPSTTDEADIVEAVKAMIDRGAYVLIILDDFHLSCKDAWRTSHQSHDSLIYGYDDSRHEFHSYGYNRGWKYGLCSIGYGELAQAFRCAAATPPPWLGADAARRWRGEWYGINVRAGTCGPPRIEAIRDEAAAFAEGRSVHAPRTGSYRWFGVTALRRVLEYVRATPVQGQDPRVHALLREYALLMRARLEYLEAAHGLRVLAGGWRADLATAARRSFEALLIVMRAVAAPRNATDGGILAARIEEAVGCLSRVGEGLAAAIAACRDPRATMGRRPRGSEPS